MQPLARIKSIRQTLVGNLGLASRIFRHQVPIYHMASLSRSGETVLLRTLRAHSRIIVVHNFYETDTHEEQALFDFLASFEEQRISSAHPLVASFKPRPGSVLLIKQAVWKHPFPFSGFVFVRNPVSVFASMKVYERDRLGTDWRKNWFRNTERMVRWLKRIDATALDGFEDLTPIDQFTVLYNRRTTQLIDTGLPIFYYEHFVNSPNDTLTPILSDLGLKFEPRMLSAHEDFAPGEIGHGDIDLGRPISTGPVYRYQQELTREEFDEVNEKTRGVSSSLGYSLSWEEIRIAGNAVPK